ncbi:hypothetical protein pb186bvf_005464 [Paramecium bursaria]
MSYYTYDYIFGLKIEGSQQQKKKSKSLKIKKDQKYQLKTLVRWQGYKQDESTWEPYKNMEEDGAFEIVKKFMQEYTYQNYIKRKQPQITDTFYCDKNIQVYGQYYSQQSVQNKPEDKNFSQEIENNQNGDSIYSDEKKNYSNIYQENQQELEQNLQEELKENKDQALLDDIEKNGKEIDGKEIEEFSENNQNEDQNQQPINDEDQLSLQKQTNIEDDEQINQSQEQNNKIKKKERLQIQFNNYDLKGGFVGYDKAIKILNHFVGKIQSLVSQEYELNLYYEVEFGYDFDGSKIKNNYSNREMLKCFEKKLFQAYIKQFPESEDLWKEIQEENKLETLKLSRKKQRTIDSD